jgi:hypothetical protein
MESKRGGVLNLKGSEQEKKVSYKYADPSFSINNMPLNETEINHLYSAIDILSQFKACHS